MICTRCGGTGFLNADQIPKEVADKDHEIILRWAKSATVHDVAVCDCCGDGEMWHGEAGRHFEGDDIEGDYGPYAYNGGLPECI